MWTIPNKSLSTHHREIQTQLLDEKFEKKKKKKNSRSRRAGDSHKVEPSTSIKIPFIAEGAIPFSTSHPHNQLISHLNLLFDD